MASILADKGVTLGKDSVRGAEGICSQLEFVHGDILLKACAVWEGGFPEVTGWVFASRLQILQTIGNKKQLL